MNATPSENDLRSLLDEGLTLYQISRHFNTTIPEIFKLGRSYGIYFSGYHGNIPKPTKQDLESMYHDEHLTQKQIGKEFDVGGSTVHRWFRYYNIQVIVSKMPPKEVLERMYIDEHLTQYQIGKEFGVNPGTVGKWLQYYNIPTRGSNGTLAVSMPPKEVLERMYIDEGMTQEEIAKEFGVSRSAVYTCIDKYNIPTRGPRGTIVVPMPPKDDLLNYINEGLNQHQIAEKYKVSDWKIYDCCEKLGIPGMVNGYRCMTPEHIEWRDAVLDRDNYICQECGAQDDLQSHHIRPYCDYPELELDVDNGITLCKRCHDNIRGREYQYIVKYEDIVLRDRGIGYHIFQPHTIIESIPCEPPLPPLSDKLFPDYQQEAIPCLG